MTTPASILVPRTSRYPSIEHLLSGILWDIQAKTVVFTPVPGTELNEHMCCGPWKGLSDIVIRYDCVAFYMDDKELEVRVSRLPTQLADIVKAIWLELEPDHEHASDIEAAFYEKRDGK